MLKQLIARFRDALNTACPQCGHNARTYLTAQGCGCTDAACAARDPRQHQPIA